MSTNISHDFWYMKSHILMLLTEDTTCSCCANDSKNATKHVCCSLFRCPSFMLNGYIAITLNKRLQIMSLRSRQRKALNSN